LQRVGCNKHYGRMSVPELLGMNTASSSHRRIITQLLRYATVGVLSNVVLYAVYLIATALGAEPKSTMTILYGAGVLQTFLFNKRWSFRDRGPEGPALVRYCVVYASGYALNYIILAVLVDHLGFAHQYVQGVTIVLLAVYLFVLQRRWVYTHQDPEGRALRDHPLGM
jgi:putative flippase GtrA